MTVIRTPRIRRDDLGGIASRRRWAHGRLYIILDKSLSAAEARAEVRRILREEGLRWRVVALAPLAAAGAAARKGATLATEHTVTTIGAAAAALAFTAAAVVAFHAPTAKTESAPPSAVLLPSRGRIVPIPAPSGAPRSLPTPAPSAARTPASKRGPQPRPTVGTTALVVDVTLPVRPPTVTPSLPVTPPVSVKPLVPAAPVSTPPIPAIVGKQQPQCLVNLDLKLLRLRLCN